MTWLFERCGYLRVAVVALFELHVLARLAAQVHPLALQPLHGGLSGQGCGVHLGDEDDVGSCNKYKHIQRHTSGEVRLMMLISEPASLTCHGDHIFWRLLHKEAGELSGNGL